MKTLQVWVAIAIGCVTTVLLAVVGYLAVRFFFPPEPPGLEIPPALTAKARTLLNITATGRGSEIHWVMLDDRATLVTWPKGDKAVFIAEENGVYHVGCFGKDIHGKVTDASVCVVTVGDAPPPGPSSPLTVKLQAAYGAETESDKAASIQALGELYLQGAAAAQSRTDLTSWGDFYNALSTVAKSVNVWGKIMGVQGVVQAELKRTLPADAKTPFDASARNLAKSTLTSLSKSIKAVNP